ncbi:hypothetical protein BC937DRAFT_88549 [Endogone sp. FLAS-F59071]|nr:hypothetical protein BC937DRAFT_88549 [Endogone sp. FLAS-F59071]|eukprot:RUS18612.1 hypothetical protein BC937DRAFT_88549 [Endogone sp. FLAS-F59071]
MRLSIIASAALLLLFNQKIQVDAVRHDIRVRAPFLRHPVYLTNLEQTDLRFTATSEDPLVSALNFALNELKASEFITKNVYTSEHNQVTHVYLRQAVGGLEVVNGDININVDRYGNIVSFGNSFYRGKDVTLRALHAEQKYLEKQDENKVEKVLKYVSEDLRLMSEKFAQIVFGASEDDDTESVTAPETESVTAPEAFNDVTFDIAPFSIPYSESDLGSPVDALQALFESMSATASAFDGVAESIPITVTMASTASFQSNEPILTLNHVPFAVAPVIAKPAYVQTEFGDLELVWSLQFQMEENWIHAHVNPRTRHVLILSDWVSDAQYNVFPLPLVDPTQGPRELLTDPYDVVASPLGWHEQKKGVKFTTTSGNNVYAQENTQNVETWETNYRPDGGDELVFDFPLDVDKDEPPSYLNASVTNLFYWNNIMHDLSYRYGFNEIAGNFQESNGDHGGLGGDAVIANAQDGSGVNNANFATPPDGQHGQMRMYVWDLSEPNRDGDLSSGIIIHEYTHGISIRLTGGPANSDCLLWDEAGGMGEGWGDFFATVIAMQPGDTREKIADVGSWAANQEGGIRKYPYSTNMEINPETYGMMNQPYYWFVHAKGEVWAGMLYEVYWNLVDKHNFTAQVFPPVPTGEDTEAPLKHILSYGNTLILQLVIDGMKLQPCNPSFVQARDAILQADLVLTGGENQCEIWAGFAKRGLGVEAMRIGAPMGGFRRESFQVPKECA